uniref:Essential MCU regulator, mitochondrial n=1 Tax=Iconisemion striatum TaxID=60296 RepID=A0A1A7YC53_9TELE
MSSALLGRLIRLSAVRKGRFYPMSPSDVSETSTGAILPRPKKSPFGLVRIALVVLPFLYVGTQISKNFAALLEEHDIFVPEDDDDDD